MFGVRTNLALGFAGLLAILALLGLHRAALPAVAREARPLAARREAHSGRLLPLFQAVKAPADRVQQLNQKNMVEANARARRRAAAANERMVLLLLLAAAVAVGFVFF